MESTKEKADRLVAMARNIVGLQSAIAWIKEHPQEGVLDTAIDEINAVINRMKCED